MNTLATLSTSLLLALPIAAQPATAVAYGASCYGLTLTSTLPVLGTTMDLTTTGVPVGAQTLTGLDLARTIAPGPFLPLPWDPNACRLHVVPSVSYPALPLGAQTVTLFLAIPNNPALLGFLFYAQSFTMSSTPWLSSNGIEARAGF